MTMLDLPDLIGTIAFAFAGASVAIVEDMDVFGVNVLGIATACGGGLVRDMILGCVPPRMFVSPFYVAVSALVASTLFIMMRLHSRLPGGLTRLLNIVFFWFDTLGLAAFSVTGVLAGVSAGYGENLFFIQCR